MFELGALLIRFKIFKPLYFAKAKIAVLSIQFLSYKQDNSVLFNT